MGRSSQRRADVGLGINSGATMYIAADTDNDSTDEDTPIDPVEVAVILALYPDLVPASE
jgi:hypothetical protein